jgi:hypothetical protein
MAELHGYALVDLWVSPRVTDPERFEASLLYGLRCIRGVRQARREYFYGLSFDRAVDVAQGLTDWRLGEWIPLGQHIPLRGYRDPRSSPATGIGAQAVPSTTS